MTSTFNITKICNAVFPPRGEMTSTMKQNQTRLLKQYSDFSLESSKLVGKYSKEAVLIKYIIHLETKLKEKENEIEDLDIRFGEIDRLRFDSKFCSNTLFCNFELLSRKFKHILKFQQQHVHKLYIHMYTMDPLKDTE